MYIKIAGAVRNKEYHFFSLFLTHFSNSQKAITNFISTNFSNKKLTLVKGVIFDIMGI